MKSIFRICAARPIDENTKIVGRRFSSRCDPGRLRLTLLLGTLQIEFLN